jgi:hypothetical protein
MVKIYCDIMGTEGRKGKFVRVNAKKAYRGSIGTPPHILILGGRWF